MLLSNSAMVGLNPGKLYSFTNAVTTDWGIYTDKGNWNKTGSLRNFPAGEASVTTLTARASRPAGNTHPVAWVMAQKAGRISSHSLAVVEISSTGNVARGSLIFTMNCAISLAGAGTGTLIIGSLIDGTSAIVIDGSATGLMTLGADGLATITVTSAGAILGHIPAGGISTIVIGALMNSTALGWLAGNGPITINADLQPYAIGWLSGTTAEAGLTPVGIANAVWSAIAASFNDPGTMGEKMNSAGGGSSPADIADAVWDELQAGHVLPESFGDLLAFVRNIEGGKWRIVGNQMIFYKADNATEIARFNLFDSAGNPTMASVFERRRV